jgi:hypothetical protein
MEFRSPGTTIPELLVPRRSKGGCEKAPGGPPGPTRSDIRQDGPPSAGEGQSYSDMGRRLLCTPYRAFHRISEPKDAFSGYDSSSGSSPFNGSSPLAPPKRGFLCARAASGHTAAAAQYYFDPNDVRESGAGLLPNRHIPNSWIVSIL